jgi:glycosyltransferase involved in cell wall biosynthesis
MRLAYLSTDPGVPWGGMKGASVHMAEVVGALVAEGTEVLVLVAAISPEAPPPPAGATVQTLPGPGKDAPTAERLRYQPALASCLVGRLRRFGAAALYERIAIHSAAGAAAARGVGVSHLVELNAPLLDEAAAYRQLEFPEDADRLEREMLVSADTVFAVSPPLVTHALARGARRVEHLPNGVAVERFRRPQGRSPTRPVAVFLGSLRPWHGLETLAGAWRLLGAAGPDLLVVGDGPGRSVLEDVGAKVTGAVPHGRVPALLARGDIGVAPYDRDAPGYFCPLKVLEYLAAGLATVAAAIPGLDGVLRPGCAILVPPGDPRALADAVSDLAEDAGKRERLSRNGRALVVAEHTWRQRARRILEVAGEVSAGARVRG